MASKQSTNNKNPIHHYARICIRNRSPPVLKWMRYGVVEAAWALGLTTTRSKEVEGVAYSSWHVGAQGRLARRTYGGPESSHHPASSHPSIRPNRPTTLSLVFITFVIMCCSKKCNLNKNLNTVCQKDDSAILLRVYPGFNQHSHYEWMDTLCASVGTMWTEIRRSICILPPKSVSSKRARTHTHRIWFTICINSPTEVKQIVQQ
jgi:hypothetical protein